ncbi:MAG: ribosome maturation factor RimP [Ruminococcaceae bacterium]|nr:ribosome maturation factor RimP [Oscillospiraceae bacterium]
MANQHLASPNKVVATVTELVSPITQENGVMLWDVRFVKEGATWILRVVIDREEEPVSINDCVAVSRRLSTVLDEVDPIPQSYCLEVTSPGADRELTRPDHFAYYVGYPVEVKLYKATDTGQKEMAGILEGYEDGTVTLRLEDDTLCAFDKKAVAAVHAIDEFELDDQVD